MSHARENFPPEFHDPRAYAIRALKRLEAAESLEDIEDVTETCRILLDWVITVLPNREEGYYNLQAVGYSLASALRHLVGALADSDSDRRYRHHMDEAVKALVSAAKNIKYHLRSPERA